MLAAKAIERFWSKVDKTPGQGPDGECWVWTGYRMPKGYGTVTLQNRKQVLSHRAAWEIETGTEPAGLCVCHRCDNASCVRASHLFLGTQADNLADKIAKGRQGKTGARGLANGRHTMPGASARGRSHGSVTKPEKTARGSQVKQAKLEEADIPVIRVLVREGIKATANLAEAYGVTFGCIHAVVHRRTWKHV